MLAEPLTHDDVEGVYAGLRPLLAGEDEATSKLSREHAGRAQRPGLVVIAGGKYTTYRVMAKDAVDDAVHGDGDARPQVPPSLHRERPAARRRRLRGGVERSGRCSPAASGLAVGARRAPAGPLRLARTELLDLIADDPTSASRWTARTTTCAPRSSTPRRTRAPATSTTLIARRTRISIETFDRGTDVAARSPS